MRLGTTEIMVIIGVAILIFGGAKLAPMISGKFKEGIGAWKKEVTKEDSKENA